MIYRFAAVAPDGSIRRIVTATSRAAVDANMPAGTTPVEAPESVLMGRDAYDFAAATFVPAPSPTA